MNFKRFMAYIIDIGLVILILSLLNWFIPNRYQKELVDLNEQYIKNEIEYDSYMEEYIIINHKMDKSNLGFNIVACLLMIGNFIVLPFFNKGQSVGKKIMNLRIKKIKRKPLLLDDLIGRSVIVDGIGYMITITILVFLIPAKSYFYIVTILGIVQILVVIISGFMILYRKDGLGIQDILTNTKLEEMK